MSVLTKLFLLSILLKTIFATVIDMIMVLNVKTNIHLEHQFYMLTKTWKYRCVCFVQRMLDDLNVIRIISGLITMCL